MSTKKQIQIVEQTAKRWKLLQFVGGVGVVIGASIVFLGIMLKGPAAGVFFVVALSIMIPFSIIYYYGRIAAWWYHG